MAGDGNVYPVGLIFVGAPGQEEQQQTTILPVSVESGKTPGGVTIKQEKPDDMSMYMQSCSSATSQGKESSVPGSSGVTIKVISGFHSTSKQSHSLLRTNPHSLLRSKLRTPPRSKSRTPSRSRSRSPIQSRSPSRSPIRSRSPSRSPIRSRSPSLSPPRSRSPTQSPNTDCPSYPCVPSRSAVWTFFKIKEGDESRTVCTICRDTISRGGRDGRTYGTTSMMRHLRGKHPTHYHKAETEKKRSVQKIDGKSQTVQRCVGTKKQYDFNHPRASRLTEAIAEMICTDLRPFSVVNDAGFIKMLSIAVPRYKLPSAKYFKETAIPDLYQTMCNRVRQLLDTQNYISITIDFWQSGANDRHMSFTAHFLDKNFERYNLCLEALPLNENHTSENILEEFEKCMRKWKLENKVVSVVHDRGSEASLRYSAYQHTPCLIDSVQRVVEAGYVVQKDVPNLIAACRELVESFRRSADATRALKERQKLSNRAVKVLIPDEPSRWDSSYNMMCRLLECKEDVVHVCRNLDSQTVLNEKQWAHMVKVVKLLEPFQESTKMATSNSATLGIVLPVVRALKTGLEPEKKDDRSIAFMKRALRTKLLQCYPRKAEWNTHFAIATLLDPRYKKSIFEFKDSCKTAVSLLTDEVETVLRKEQASTRSESPLPETAQTANSSKAQSRLFQLMTQIVSSSRAPYHEDSDFSAVARQIVNDYLASPPIPIQDVNDDYKTETFWLQYTRAHTSASALGEVARKFLCAPPSSSASSEEMFSTSGDACTSHHCRLCPDRLDKLFFLNKNLKWKDM